MWRWFRISWEDIFKTLPKETEGNYRGQEPATAEGRYGIGYGGQKDVRVEYINNEMKKDVDDLIKLMKEVPSPVFHELKRAFKTLIDDYQKK